MAEARRYDTKHEQPLRTSPPDEYTWKYPASFISEFSEQTVQSNTLFNEDNLCNIQRPNFSVGTVVIAYASSIDTQCCEKIMCIVLGVDRSLVHVCVIDSCLHEQVTFSVDFFHIHEATDAEIYQWRTLPQL